MATKQPQADGDDRARLVQVLNSLRALLARGPRRDTKPCFYFWARDYEPSKVYRDAYAALSSLYCGAPNMYRGAPRVVGVAIDDLSHNEIYPLDELPAPDSVLRKLSEFIEDLGGKAPRRLAVPMTPEEQTILEALADNHPTTMTRADLTHPTRLTEKTIGKYLLGLRKKKLVYYPRGDKKGNAITEAGKLAIGR